MSYHLDDVINFVSMKIFYYIFCCITFRLLQGTISSSLILFFLMIINRLDVWLSVDFCGFVGNLRLSGYSKLHFSTELSKFGAHYKVIGTEIYLQLLTSSFIYYVFLMNLICIMGFFLLVFLNILNSIST